MKKAAAAFLLLLVCTSPGWSGTDPEEIVEEADGSSTMTVDRDQDGRIDYLMRLGPMGEKEYEEIDYNKDGAMDDFYYYSEGILVKREIDTNFDEAVDIWVTIREGVYIERYERDLDFDGTVDETEDFSEE